MFAHSTDANLSEKALFEELNSEEVEEPLSNFEYTAIPRFLPNDALLKLSQNVEPVTTFRANQIDRDLRKNWDIFYKRNGTRFFKDRHWPIDDISRLIDGYCQNCGLNDSTNIPIRFLELGCGVGNLLFPLLESHLYHRPSIHFFACDFSPRAIDIVRTNPLFLQVSSIHAHDITPPTTEITSPTPTARCRAFVCNIATDDLASIMSSQLGPTTVPSSAPTAPTPDTPTPSATIPGTEQLDQPSRPGASANGSPSDCDFAGVDLATLVFVLSALPPSAMRGALANAYRSLRPGGLLLVRDYALHDIAQLRLHRRHHWLPDRDADSSRAADMRTPNAAAPLPLHSVSASTAGVAVGSGPESESESSPPAATSSSCSLPANQHADDNSYIISFSQLISSNLFKFYLLCNRLFYCREQSKSNSRIDYYLLFSIGLN